MAITDVINQSWEGETHGEVERALKAALSQIMEMLEGIDSSGLTPEQVALLERARTALQPSDVSQAGKTGSYNDLTDKPNYEGEVAMGSLDSDGSFHELIQEGDGGSSTYGPAVTPDPRKLYVNIQTGVVLRWRGVNNPAYEPLVEDSETISLTSRKPVSSRVLAAKFEAISTALAKKVDNGDGLSDLITQIATEIIGDGSTNPVLDEGTHIPYNLLPRLVLDGMNHAHSEVNINTQNNGKCFYCTDKKIRYYYGNGAKWVTSDPDKGIIYCDRSEKKLYIWNATQSKMDAFTVGGGGLTEDEVNGLIASAIDGYVQQGEDGRIPEALITNKDGKIPYSWMPSCYLDSINYVKGLKPTYELVGKVLFTTSGKILTVAATLVNNTSAYTWVEQDPSAGVMYWFENRPYRWNPSKGELEPYHMYNIAIVGADEAVPDWADLCFFRASEDEGGGGGTVPDDPVTPDPDDPTPPEPEVITIEGDNFNALLAGNDPQTVYNPSMPYNLDGVVDVNDLNTEAPAFSYETNTGESDLPFFSHRRGIMYYNYEDNGVTVSVRTPMRRYGELVVSHSTKMADTADTAYISFMVSGPFFEQSTSVRVNYDDSVVDVYCWTKATGKTLNRVANGENFIFANTDAAKEVMLVIKRKSIGMGSGCTTSALATLVELVAGSNVRDVKVIFNPTRVFYRNGGVVRGSGFTIDGANAIVPPAPVAEGGISRLSAGEGCLLVSESGKYCPLVNNVLFDTSKFNVFYIVLGNRTNSWIHAMMYDDSWDGAWVTVDGVKEPRHHDVAAVDSTVYNFYQHSYSLGDTTLRNNEADVWLKERTGNFVLNCFLHAERDIENTQKRLDLYIGKTGGQLKVLEFGIITYDTTLL